MGIINKLTAIADAIRLKTGETGRMKLADMPGKIMSIGFPVLAFTENTDAGCHVSYGVNPDYTIQLDGCSLSGTAKLALVFQGTSFDILTRTADANLKVSVYDADQYELKSYTYEEGKVFISAVKKAGAPADAKALKTVTINASYGNGTVDQIPLISMDLEKYGSYIVLAQRIGSGEESLRVDGIKIR